ncbi:hypothetical protein PHLGIDRAFT_29221 [Phlebiopsis gigantea 11061_1 CR5-6]|uniref:ClpP/crotonase n=1 Tax=Phlebiopsis gigantea (strain 11061_1 CR5-6) TaxID=745531 RepID=A0A0C3SCT7_PHLG1|nr:hypothetical protein PHLGIDRAFT_29221 [Phlebiopsis gigantea 11061_1 CR5-6]
MQPGVNVEIDGVVATITFNRPKTLNAITAEDYDAFAEALYAVDQREDVLVTIWQATGRFFCAGTDVTQQAGEEANTVRKMYLSRVARGMTDTTRALSSHRKLLVAAVHGPALGIAAAFLGHFDFIYCLPDAYLSLPFTFLGIITESGSSVTFVRRLGIAKANEALILGKKLTAQELLESRFVNKIFPKQPLEAFQAAVKKQVQDDLDSLEPSAVLQVKSLIRYACEEQNSIDSANLRESYAQAARLAGGIPRERFAQIARKEIKHKL